MDDDEFGGELTDLIGGGVEEREQSGEASQGHAHQHVEGHGEGSELAKLVHDPVIDGLDERNGVKTRIVFCG